jgi:hypothetical protein
MLRRPFSFRHGRQPFEPMGLAWLVTLVLSSGFPQRDSKSADSSPDRSSAESEEA